MPKKMFDILPPKVAHKVENTIKELEVDNKKKRAKINKESNESPAPVKSYGTQNQKEKKFPLKEILIGIFVIVFLLVVYGVMKLPRATIQIWPSTETLAFSDKIVADKSVNAPDTLNKIIPARYMEETKDGSEVFDATGSASNDGKATGSIKVYNKTDSAFTLVKGTHFLSDSGKYFVTTVRINIPGKKNNSPGSVTVSVQAEESGKEYNIGPSKFSAPKLYGTTYYYNIYGESTDAMSGGYTGTVKKVTDDDIKQAKDSLTKKLLQDTNDSLKSKLSQDEVLLDGAIESSVISDSSDVKSGTVIDKFGESAKVKITALVFKKQDLQKLVKDDIAAQLPDDNNFLQESLDTKYNVTSVDMQNGKLTLDVGVLGKTYYNIKTDQLLNLFEAKSSDQIKQIVDQLYKDKVSELKINFWPFWVHKVPNNKASIHVNLNF